MAGDKLYPILPLKSKRFRPKKKVRLYPIITGVSPRDKPSKLPFSAWAVRYERRMYSLQTQKSNNSTSVWLNTTSQITAVNCSRTFTNNRNWRKEVELGQDATYPYTRSVASVKPVSYSLTTESSSYISRSSGTVGGQATVNPLPDTDLVQIATGRLKNRLKGYIGSARLAAPLAESREIHRIARQIHDLGISFTKSLLAVKKSRGKSALSFLSDTWLGFNFGVNPMLKDMQGAADAILEYQTRSDRCIRVSGTANRDYFANGSNSPGSEAFGTTLWIATQNTQKQGVRIVAGIDLKIGSDASYSVADHLGLKFSETLPVLWELTAYSWALDYFFTVSPWLDDMFFTIPGMTKYVSMTRKYQNVARWGLLRHADQAGFKTTGYVSPGYFKYASIVRSKLALLPTRSLRVKSADEIAQYSLSKFLNLASVLGGRYGTRMHR